MPPRELESRTFRLSSECSNQLSYGGIVWHPGKGSNLERLSQSQLCYHYTTREQIFWHPARDSNSHQGFWRPVCCHYTSETQIWWTVTGSNRSSRLAKPVCPQQHLQPIFLNTLLRMCVLKSTVCDISVQVSSMLFNTLPFYTLTLSPLAYHPVGRPHLQFKVMPARVAIALNEKPRGF